MLEQVKVFRGPLSAFALASALALTGVLGASADAAGATSPQVPGRGAVDIKVLPGITRCRALGALGACTTYGAGVAAANQWSTDEVITVYHLIEGAADDGSAIRVEVPGTSTEYAAYVQRTDPAADLALLRIGRRDGNATSVFTPARLPVTTGAPLVGAQVTTSGDGNGDSYDDGTPMDTHDGRVLSDATDDVVDDAGTPRTLHDTIESDTGCIAGDSGGPLSDGSDQAGDAIVVQGIHEGSDTSGNCYAIPIRSAVADLLSTRP